MSSTPLLRKIKKGTLVVFQSTERDLQPILQGNSSKGYKLSKFALLNIPTIKTPINYENTINFDNIESVFTVGKSTASPPPEGDKTDLSESLQNYLLNMENLVISDESYNNLLYQNTAERLFFKWLKEIGAVRFRQVNTEEIVTGISNRYVEEDDNSDVINGDIYNRVIQYVGEIDMTGSNASSNVNAYSETYIYVPSVNGNTPTIIFKSVSDDNYYPNKIIKLTDVTKQEYIIGRDSTDDPSPAGLSVVAQYDMDVPFGVYQYKINGVDGTWFQQNILSGPNAYFTDSTFTDPTNDIIDRKNVSTSKEVVYKRSRLDGIGIDFDTANYLDFSLNNSLKYFNEYNASDKSKSFEFNAIAIYYDLFDKNNPTVGATNLYGIVFLNNLEAVSTGASKLTTYKKIKQNNIIGQQGDGLGFRLNLKLDMNPDDVKVDVEVSVNDYNTYSMQLFSEMMARMNKLNANYEKLLAENASTKIEYDKIKGLILSDTQKAEISAEIEGLKKAIQTYTDDSAVLALLQSNEQKIKDILNGNTSVNISYNLDVLAYDGLGITLEDGVLKLTNSRQAYYETHKFIANFNIGQQLNKNNILTNGKFDTLWYSYDGDNVLSAQENIFIYIDDTIGWKNGQLFTLSFKSEILMNGYGFIFYTDVKNKFKLTQAYNKLIGLVTDVKSTTPTFDIFCVNETTYDFIIIQK